MERRDSKRLAKKKAIVGKYVNENGITAIKNLEYLNLSKTNFSPCSGAQISL